MGGQAKSLETGAPQLGPHAHDRGSSCEDASGLDPEGEIEAFHLDHAATVPFHRVTGRCVLSMSFARVSEAFRL